MTQAEVYDRPKNLRAAGFVGPPAINRIEGQVDDAGQFVRWRRPRTHGARC